MPSDGGSSNDDGSGNDRSNESSGYGGGDGNDIDSGWGGGIGDWGGPDLNSPEMGSSWGNTVGGYDNEAYGSFNPEDPGFMANLDNALGNPDWGSMATNGLGLAGMAFGLPAGLVTAATTAAGLLNGPGKFAGNVAGRIGGALGNAVGGLPGQKAGQSLGSKIGNWSGDNTQDIDVGEYDFQNNIDQKGTVLDDWYTPNRSVSDQLRNFKG